MRILFYQRSDVINSSGGTEKVLCFLSSELANLGYDVIFMTNEKKDGKPFFPLNSKVKFINIGGTNFSGFKKILFKLIKSTPLLKRFKGFDNYKYTSDVVYKNIEEIKPDLVILANPQDLVELCYSHTYNFPIIQMIHNVPWNIFARKSKSILKITLDLMKNVKVCQVLMPSFVELMKPYYDGKVVVIPNYVPEVDDNQTVKYNDKDVYKIINIARINRIKNQELLIKAFSLIANKYKNWNIEIWGTPDKRYIKILNELINKNNLQNRIFFRGKTKEPLKELQNADIFAFPSIFEGFGLSLTEAMAVGLPSIGLKTAPAVNEIIVDNDNGLLSENTPEDFANKLEILILNRKLREKLGISAKESVKKYSKEKILTMWQKLIKESLYENS